MGVRVGRRMEPADLLTARLRLHPAHLADLDSLHALWVTPDVRRYLWDDQIISRDLAAATLESCITSFGQHGYGLWIVRRIESSDAIGFCGLRSAVSDDPELLYGLARLHWGQGLATEAAAAVVRHAFEALDVERIRALTDVPNVASEAVMRRLGMTFEGRAQVNGIAVVTYALSRAQFRGR